MIFSGANTVLHEMKDKKKIDKYFYIFTAENQKSRHISISFLVHGQSPSMFHELFLLCFRIVPKSGTSIQTFYQNFLTLHGALTREKDIKILY